jgi:hypothetical protein
VILHLTSSRVRSSRINTQQIKTNNPWGVVLPRAFFMKFFKTFFVWWFVLITTCFISVAARIIYLIAHGLLDLHLFFEWCMAKIADIAEKYID